MPDDTPTTPPSSRRGKLLVGGLLAAALLVLFFRGTDWREIGLAFRSARPLYLVGVVFATLLVYLSRAWRWGYLLAPLARVSFLDLFSATVVGFMTGLLIPRAGEVVRPYLVARRHDLKTSAAFASIILERLVDLITVLILFALYLYALPHPEQQTRGALFGWLKTAGALVGIGALGILGVLLALHSHAGRVVPLVERMVRPLPRRVADLVVGMFRSFASGLGVLQASPAHLLAIFGQSLLVWMAIALGLWWNNLAFGVDLPFQTTFLLLGFLTVGVAVPTPGMVGGFHEAYKLCLVQAFGVDEHRAVAAAIASHALTNLPVLFLGLAFLGREGLSMGKVADMTEGERKP